MTLFLYERFCFVVTVLVLIVSNWPAYVRAQEHETLIQQPSELKKYSTAEKIKLGIEYWSNPEAARDKQVYLAVPMSEVSTLNSEESASEALNSPDGIAIFNENTNSYKWYTIQSNSSSDPGSLPTLNGPTEPTFDGPSGLKLNGSLGEASSKYYLYNYQTTPGLSGLNLKGAQQLIAPSIPSTIGRPSLPNAGAGLTRPGKK